MYNTPHNHGTTHVSTQPYKGLSIGFSLSGTTSDYSGRKNIYEGINGETFCILVTDHFTGMKNGDAIIFKASPIDWLRNFLTQYPPTYNNKYIHLDQGGKLFNNPYVKNFLNNLAVLYIPLELILPIKMGQLNDLIEY